MKTKNLLKSAIVVFLIIFSFGCAARKSQTMSQHIINPSDFQKIHCIAKVDNFIVILDASSSMGDPPWSQSKFFVAKDVLSAMNQTIPDLKINGALRTFGYHPDVSRNLTELFYGAAPYSKLDFEKALSSASLTGGTSPLDKAIEAAGEDLASFQGKSAVIIVSDFDQMDDAPVNAAEKMTARLGDRVCIYTVLIGNDAKGRRISEAIADAGQCGSAVWAIDLIERHNMSDFVEKVFFERQTDPDGDGVYGDVDDCPGTPAGAPVDKNGCPLDSDGDGVYDYMDQCPGTPAGTPVDKNGCMAYRYRW